MTGERDVPGDRVLLQLERPSPRLPARSLSLLRRTLAAGLMHGAVVGLLLLVTSGAPGSQSSIPAEAARNLALSGPAHPPRIVFLVQPGALTGRGGGGGGNRRQGVILRAQAPGRDTVTMPVARAPEPGPTVDRVTSPQQIALDARPLAAGSAFVIGLPDAVSPLYGDALGPGSGGGVGDGEGSGIGSGRGPGAGPGSGGGAGGGTYRPGGSVSPPVLLHEVLPIYTPDALRNRSQGSVWLELIVKRDGSPERIRVMRSLDPGLDDEAVNAVRQWRFRPGRLGDEPVDVLVNVIVDFHVH